MNAALCAIAALEANPRLMLPPPSAHHDHGGGATEEVPLINREFLLKCGTEALYIVLSQMEVDERFEAETKEELADLIISKTQGQQPEKSELMPPIIPPRPVSAREKRFGREMKRQVKAAMKEARTHGDN